MNLFAKSIQWLTDKLFPQKSKPVPKEGVDYVFHDIHVDMEWVSAIKLLDGPYKDVVYCYGRLRVDPTSNDICQVAFDYKIFEIPKHVTYDMVKSDEFKKVIGDILVGIIMTQEGEHVTAREHYSKESDI